jgi:L-galactose dehydrogenase/L-glyceraldehyde 3-phosphate reductase
LRPQITLATKVMLRPEERGEIATAVPRSLEASLRRLGRDSVDLLQLHNLIGSGSQPAAIAPEAVLEEVVPALERLRDAGRIRFAGFTGLGETAAVHRLIDSGRFDSAQVAYNLLNPSASVAVPAGFPAQDFGGLIGRAGAAGMGTIGIRAIAGGALSGSAERHPTGMSVVPPIGSGSSYETDVERARAFLPLLAEAGASDLVELALRFAISDGGPTTVLVGTSTLEQLEHAIAAVERGPLPLPALESAAAIWRRMAHG